MTKLEQNIFSAAVIKRLAVFCQRFVRTLYTTSEIMSWSRIAKHMRTLPFFAEFIFAVLGTVLAFETLRMKSSFSKFALVFVWMALLHWMAYAAEVAPTINAERLKRLQELKDVNLSDFVPPPKVTIAPIYMQEKDFSADAKSDPQFKKLEQILKYRQDDEPMRAYKEAERYLSQYRNTAVGEYLMFLKADCLYQSELKKDEPRLQPVLEEYLDATRSYPLHSEIPRALYQIGLLQLELGFYPDVDATITRAIKDFGSREYASDYHLISADQAFRTKNSAKAMSEYSFVIQNYPRSHAAVDSAFRKAFILFRDGDFKGAYQVYSVLEKFHSEEIDALKLEKDVSSTERLVDRVFYAETIFLNGKYTQAAKYFQDLGNLFPTHPVAPFVLFRLADTYMNRGQIKAAEELYRFVLERHQGVPLVEAMGKAKLADLYYLTKDRKAAKFNEKYLRESFEQARKVENDVVASLSLAKLALYYLTFEVYPRAQTTLRQYRTLYRESENQDWVEKRYIETVEMEILDYYQHEEYLAALAVYLSHERERVFNFTDTRALLNLADAAKRLGLIDKSTQILNHVIYLEKSSEGRQEALLRLVDLLIGQGEFKKASERLRRFNFAYPASSLRYLYEMAWGNLYLGMKNPEQAAFHYEKAIQATKGKPSAEYEIRHIHMRLGTIYEELVLTEKAIDSYNRFIKVLREWTDNKLASIRPTSKDEYLLKVARQKIADMHYAMHDYPRAIEGYRAVAETTPDEPFNSNARYRIGECYLALNDRRAAIDAFKKVSSSESDNVWVKAAKSYIASVELEVKYGIRIFN